VSDEKALMPVEAKAVSPAERRRQKVSSLVDSITLKSLKYAAGLHEPEFVNGLPNPKWNPDAEKPWVEASTRTRFSVEVYKQTMANRREQQQTERTLGVLLLRERMKDDDWEKHAQQVDQDLKVIDVTVTEGK
jgi:hypothetical protein